MWWLVNKNGLWKMDLNVCVEKVRVLPDTTPVETENLIPHNLVINLDAPNPPMKQTTSVKIWQKKGVLLERGHGPNPKGFEPGAVAHGVTEYELNGIAVEAARNYLTKQGIPCEVTDSGSSLHEIGRLAQGYDVFVSVHHNAFNAKAQGVECLYHNASGDPADKQLAELIAQNLFKSLGYSNRGAKPQALGVLSGAETTDTRASVLAECYFMDAVPTGQRDNSRLAGLAIGQAVEKWLKTTTIPTVDTSVATLRKTASGHTGTWTGLDKLVLSVGDQTFYVASGVEGAQYYRKPSDPKSFPKNLEPIPQGIYTIGAIDWADGKDDYDVSHGPGLGPVWVPITATFDDDRSAFGFHLDENISTSGGSAGCVVFPSMEELKRFVAALRKFDPKTLKVDWAI